MFVTTVDSQSPVLYDVFYDYHCHVVPLGIGSVVVSRAKFMTPLLTCVTLRICLSAICQQSGAALQCAIHSPQNGRRRQGRFLEVPWSLSSFSFVPILQGHALMHDSASTPPFSIVTVLHKRLLCFQTWSFLPWLCA